MIVEVFYKGSNFKRFYDSFWNIKKINRSGHHFILATEYGEEDVFLDTEKYELRVSY